MSDIVDSITKILKSLGIKTFAEQQDTIESAVSTVYKDAQKNISRVIDEGADMKNRADDSTTGVITLLITVLGVAVVLGIQYLESIFQPLMEIAKRIRDNGIHVNAGINI